MLWHALPDWLSLLTVDDGTCAVIAGCTICLHIETTLGCECEAREERYRVGEIVARPAIWIALIKRVCTRMVLMCAHLVWLYGVRWHCCNWLSRDASASSNSTGKHSGSEKCIPKCPRHIPPCGNVIFVEPRVCLDCNGLTTLSQQEIGKSARNTKQKQR